MVFERFLELCLEHYNIDDLTVEDPTDFDDSEFIFYSPVAYSSYYHEIARRWAAHKNLSCSVTRNANGEKAIPSLSKSAGLDVRARSYWKGRHVLIERISRYVMEWTASWLTRLSNLWAYCGGDRHFIFYMPCRASGLRPKTPKFAVDVSIVLKGCLLFQRFWQGDSPQHVEAHTLDECLRLLPAKSQGVANQLVKERCVKYFEKTHEKGISIFDCFVALLNRMHRWGLNIAYLATTPFVDWNYEGYITEAFRKTGCKIAGIQHGGNVRLQQHGGVVPILSGFMGKLYFQWGNACTDDHSQYGIKYDCHFLTTGSPRTKELLQLKANGLQRPLLGSNIKILYAPTIISVFASYGSQIVWDGYIKIFKSVCEILNASRHECSVKLLRSPGIECFDLSAYPRIHFLREGGFVDYMWKADYLVVDSLGGSPIYESLTTDKPILLYAGIENQVWDEKYIEMLKQRVICFFDAKSYIEGVQRFVEDPKDYVLRSGIRIGSEIMDEYMPSVTKETFWSVIHESFFELKVGTTATQQQRTKHMAY